MKRAVGYFLVLVLTSAFPVFLSAQETLTVSGSYTYRAAPDITPEQARIIALERAKIQIMAEHFGTVVRADNMTFVSNENGGSSVSFYSAGGSEVKGEWLSTVGEPNYEIVWDDEMDALSVMVHVTGNIREVTEAGTSISVKLLRNGQEDRFESDEFRVDDDLYISFTSQERGYLAIYLSDRTGVYRLLPLRNRSDLNVFPVSGGEKYVFFTGEDENLKMECSGESEVDGIYTVFSPNRFSAAVEQVPDSESRPAFMDMDAFMEWLSICRRRDVDMTVCRQYILIHK